MFSRVRIAIRFFFVGLAVGILLAPRSGEATRRMIREKADRLLNDVLDAAALGIAESGAGGGAGGGASAARPKKEADAGADASKAAPKRSRGNGGRTRTTRSTTATEAGV